jgi:hypothetical protein
MSSDDEKELLERVKMPLKKPAPKKFMSEKQKIACAANIRKAHEGRKKLAEERRGNKTEEKLALEELVAERKKRVFGEEIAKAQTNQVQVEQQPDSPQVFGDSEDSEDEDKSPSLGDSDESDDESAEESDESESDGEAEFVLKKKTPKKAAAKAKVTKKKKEKRENAGVFLPKKSKLLEQMELMAAELQALKAQKRKKAAPVNVYVNHPEPKKLTDQDKKKILDL